MTASASGATISYSQNFALGFDSFLFAEGGSGVIQCQATGMADPVTIDLSAHPAGMQIIPLALPTTGSGTVTFTVITPPVTLYGANILNQTMSGVLVHKMGVVVLIPITGSMQWISAGLMLLITSGPTS